MENERDGVGSLDVAEAPPELDEPKMYKVIIQNDDFTPMELVVVVLKVFFHMTDETAEMVMLEAHKTGKAVCGTFTRDIAETKAKMVNDFAQSEEQPLQCETEVV